MTNQSSVRLDMQHNSELLLILRWVSRHNAKPHVISASIVILKILLLSLRYLRILLYYSLSIQNMIQHE